MVSLPGISASDRPNVGRQDAGATGGRGRDNEEERRRGSLRDNRAVANTTRESPCTRTSFIFTGIARCSLAAFTSQLSIPHMMKYAFYSEAIHDLSCIKISKKFLIILVVPNKNSPF